MSFSLTGLAQAVIDALAWLLSMLYVPLGWLLDAFVYILKAIPWLIIDGVLTAVLTFFQALDFSSVVFQWGAGYAGIPSVAVYLMNAVGFPQMVTLIGAAYALRLAMNLIPSWATRV